jgi:RNA recognition motif-containing protein
LKQRRLFVKNIPKSMTDRELLRLFRSLFNIEKAYQIRKVQDHGMGYGYAIFSRKEGAQSALSLARQN